MLAAAAPPDLRRRDRKLLQCFVNRRRVSEFSLLQAAEYGYAGYLPGGWHPAAFIFVEIDPGLIDFNIHPAKKEVRFRNLPEVHASVVKAVRSLLEPLQRAVPAAPAPRSAAPLAAPLEFTLPAPLPPVPGPAATDDHIRFLGQVFGVFLVFELPERLLLMDQHAAHERIIFERLGAQAPALQEMLFPLCFDVSSDEEKRILAACDELQGMGVSLRRAGPRALEVTAVSADFQRLGEDRLVELVRGVGGAEWQYSLRAAAACRLAIKEGDRVDPLTARELCARALELPVARCPHGRPIWHQLSEETLLRLVDRPPPESPSRSPR